MDAAGPFFSGAVARLRSFRDASSKDFDFLVAEGASGRQKVATLNGRGDLRLHAGGFDLDKVARCRAAPSPTSFSFFPSGSSFSFSSYLRQICRGRCMVVASHPPAVCPFLSGSTLLWPSPFFLPAPPLPCTGYPPLPQGSISVHSGGVSVSEGTLSVDGRAQVTARAGGGGLGVALASAPLDASLAALGLGPEGGRVGVSFEGGALLSVTAPEVTMASLMDSGDADTDSSGKSADGGRSGGSGFDFLSVGPDAGVADGAQAVSAEEAARARRAASFLRVDHRGKTHVGPSAGAGASGQGSLPGPFGKDERFGLTVHSGDLAVDKGGASFEGAVLVGGGLTVAGPIGVEVKSGPLVVREGNALVRSPSRTQPALSVSATAASNGESTAFSSTVLDLAMTGGSLTGGGLSSQRGDFKDPSSESGHFIRASRTADHVGGDGTPGSDDGAVLFSVDGAGGVSTSGGVVVNAGGVAVEGGGVRVASGGLAVEGGVQVLSGALDIATQEGLTVSHGGLDASTDSLGKPALLGRASSPDFRGSVARLEAKPRGSEGASGSTGAGTMGGGEDVDGASARFNFLEARLEGADTPLMSVDGRGVVHAVRLEAQGDVVAGNGLFVGGPASLTAPGVRAPATVSAGASIVVDPCRPALASSYVRIASDGAAALNKLSLPASSSTSSSSSLFGSKCAHAEGQLLLIYNGDEEGTSGDAEIPSGRAVVFVFSAQAGPGWVPLTTLDARSSQLDGITSLTAKNNLDLGPHALKAMQLVASGQSKGEVAMYGSGGLLAGSPKLTYDDKHGLLTTPKLSVKQVDSSGVDFMGSPLTNVRLESGSAAGLTTVRTKELYVESLGSEGGQLLVAGKGSSVTAAPAVYVSTQDSSSHPTSSDKGEPKKLPTLSTPALRVGGLSPYAGSVALAGVHGEVVGRRDVGVDILVERAAGTGSNYEAVSMGEAADLARRGKPTTAVLRAPRVATAVLVGATPVTTTVSGEGTEEGAEYEVTTMKAEVSVEGDLVLGGHKLVGADIVDSKLTGLDELGVTWLTVRAATGSTLAYFSPNSTLQSLPGAVVGAGGALSFGTVGIAKLSEDLDVGGHTLSNLKVTGGNLDGLKSVGTDSLTLTDAALAVAAASAASSSSSSSSSGAGSGSSRKLFALFGPGGKVEAGPAGLSYDAEARVLHAQVLGGHALGGDVDAKGHQLKGASVTGGSVSGVSEVQSEGGLSCKGDLDVGEDGSVGGTLVVGGTVMGSGPYVDSSDRRFKMDVEPLFEKKKTRRRRRKRQKPLLPV